ncbi:MAG: hypothetical protein OXU67_05900 [Chloroflexota bacterium]|nr:hypothetical protein [Chloroflexota bacterium]
MTTELKRVSLGDFAANLTAIIERVASAGESVVVENDGRDVVVVNPAVPQRPRKRMPTRYSYRGPGGVYEEFDSIEALKERLDRPRTPAEQARLSAVVEQILANRKERNIAPMTTAELVRKGRERGT